MKVIGLGGVGAPVAQALAQFLAFQRVCDTLVLVDGDAYEARNRERVLFDATGNKAVIKAHELAQACDGRLTILPVAEYVGPGNVRRLVGEGDAVLLCVDNHATRKLVSDRCRRLWSVVLISGGNDGIEDGRTGTYGNVQAFVRRAGRDVTNPLTRFHPELARPRDRRPDQQGCAAGTPIAPQLLFTNLTVAAAMLGTFYAWLAGTLAWEEVYLDIGRGTMLPVQRAVSGASTRHA
ncbi:MAG: ThiF family adenylyltransferase [Acidobacteria bacterium]|nr:ThiF family adenylyltransferase [Acidobacteriota bacterium]